jgi:hypothetical protein
MTYNFDIEQWWEREYEALKFRLDSGEIDQAAFDRELEQLQDRYDEMGARLDGTYRIPHSG